MRVPSNSAKRCNYLQSSYKHTYIYIHAETKQLIFHTVRWASQLRDCQTNRHTDIRPVRRTGRQRDRQTDRPTDSQTVSQSDTQTLSSLTLLCRTPLTGANLGGSATAGVEVRDGNCGMGCGMGAARIIIVSRELFPPFISKGNVEVISSYK